MVFYRPLRHLFCPIVGVLLGGMLMGLQGCSGFGMGNQHRLQKGNSPSDGVETRRDWGICGGSFLPDGTITFDTASDPAVACMRAKGYTLRRTGSEPVVIYWVKRDTGEDATIDAMVACGAVQTAPNRVFAAPLILERYTACMRDAGYEIYEGE